MKKKNDKPYLDYILRCIARIEEDTADGKAEFLSKHMIQDAVLRNLQTLAESTQQISTEVKQAHPEINWKD